jgi:hypothetical protein
VPHRKSRFSIDLLFFGTVDSDEILVKFISLSTKNALKRLPRTCTGLRQVARRACCSPADSLAIRIIAIGADSDILGAAAAASRADPSGLTGRDRTGGFAAAARGISLVGRGGVEGHHDRKDGAGGEDGADGGSGRGPLAREGGQEDAGEGEGAGRGVAGREGLGEGDEGEGHRQHLAGERERGGGGGGGPGVGAESMREEKASGEWKRASR